jgi:hypothetical protein
MPACVSQCFAKVYGGGSGCNVAVGVAVPAWLRADGLAACSTTAAVFWPQDASTARKKISTAPATPRFILILPIRVTTNPPRPLTARGSP